MRMQGKVRTKSKFIRVNAQFDLAADDAALLLVGLYSMQGKTLETIPAHAGQLGQVLAEGLGLYGLHGIVEQAKLVEISDEQMLGLQTFLASAFSCHMEDPDA